MSEGSRAKKRSSNAPDRRPLRFWDPFNLWWRAELEKTGKRASSDDIARWYAAQSNYAWGPEKPSLQETRTHAKCLRSVSSVRDYFREYRAKKKHEQSEMELDEEEEDDRRSKSNASRRGSRSRAARSTSTAGYSGSSAAMQSYMAYDEHGYWGSGFLEGAASGVTTAAGQAAAAAATAYGNIQGAAAAQAMAEYEQQMAASGMGYLHPGAIDLAWANYQQAMGGAAVTSQGPVAPAAPTADQEQQQHIAGQAGSAARTDFGQFWQHLGGVDPSSSSQQQEHTQQPGLGVLQIPQGGPTAGRASLSSLLSPGLQQQLAGGNWQAFQAEMPSISPRMPQPLQTPAALQGLQQAPGSTRMGPPAALTNPHPVQHGTAAEGSRRILQSGTTLIKPDPEDAQRQQHHHAVHPPAHMWDLAAHEQYGHMEVQYGGGIGQDYALPGTATPFGGLGARYQQPQHYAVTAPPPSGPHRLDRLERPLAVHPAASAPAPAGKAGRPCVSLSHSAPAAPHAGACAEAGDCADPPDSTRHGVIPASLLAAVPLPTAMPGCPGHTTVDSILQQLEAGVRTPRGFAAAAMTAGPGGQQPFTQRASLSTMLEGASLMPPGAGATRQLSQSFEHMPLAHQRLSLYAMGSGMLDMLSEGLDLDGFLATADLPGGAAANGNGPDAAAHTTANRQSLRWLRTSCQMQVPEQWQQHLQNLQEEPAAARGAQGNSGPAHAGQTLAAVPPGNQLFMRRASSTGIDALAEAAAAALAAHPELLMQGCRGGAAPSAQGAPEQLGPSAAEQGGEEEAGRSAGPSGAQRKRMREEAGPAGCRPKTEMGPPATSFKRACAGLGISLPDHGAQQAPDASKAQGFKFVLDLATPKPEATPAPASEQQQLVPAAGQVQPACVGGLQEEEEEAAAGGLQARVDLTQKRPVVLDLRPEELGATSENCTPAAALQHAPAQPVGAPEPEPQPQQRPQQESTVGAAAGPQQGRGVRKVEALMLPPLQSPAGGAGGINTRGALQLGPATAASTTGAPPRGPSGELLPAPAMAHIEMAAAMQAAAMRSLLLQGQQLHAGGSGGPAPMPPSDPAKRLLPAMHEIERMI